MNKFEREKLKKKNALILKGKDCLCRLFSNYPLIEDKGESIEFEVTVNVSDAFVGLAALLEKIKVSKAYVNEKDELVLSFNISINNTWLLTCLNIWNSTQSALGYYGYCTGLFYEHPILVCKDRKSLENLDKDMTFIDTNFNSSNEFHNMIMNGFYAPIVNHSFRKFTNGKQIWVSELTIFLYCKFFFKDTVHVFKDDWLGNLSLDIYIPSIKIGIEYQGEQHYKRSFFNKTDEDLSQQIERDKRKRELCKQNNVKLIEFTSDDRIDNIRDFMLAFNNKIGNTCLISVLLSSSNDYGKCSFGDLITNVSSSQSLVIESDKKFTKAYWDQIDKTSFTENPEPEAKKAIDYNGLISGEIEITKEIAYEIGMNMFDDYFSFKNRAERYLKLGWNPKKRDFRFFEDDVKHAEELGWKESEMSYQDFEKKLDQLTNLGWRETKKNIEKLDNLIEEYKKYGWNGKGDISNFDVRVDIAKDEGWDPEVMTLNQFERITYDLYDMGFDHKKISLKNFMRIKEILGIKTWSSFVNNFDSICDVIIDTIYDEKANRKHFINEDIGILESFIQLGWSGSVKEIEHVKELYDNFKRIGWDGKESPYLFLCNKEFEMLAHNLEQIDSIDQKAKENAIENMGDKIQKYLQKTHFFSNQNCARITSKLESKGFPVNVGVILDLLHSYYGGFDDYLYVIARDIATISSRKKEMFDDARDDIVFEEQERRKIAMEQGWDPLEMSIEDFEERRKKSRRGRLG